MFSYNMKNLLTASIQNKASDLHVTVGLPPMLRINGTFKRYGQEILDAQDTERLVKEILSPDQFNKLNKVGEVDCSISLGGNRVKQSRWIANILIVFVVSGLWHGAAWTFVLWGGIHGVLLCFHKYYKNTFGAKINTPDTIKIPLTFLLVTFCWIFFRGDNLSNIGQIFSKLMSNVDILVRILSRYEIIIAIFGLL